MIGWLLLLSWTWPLLLAALAPRPRLWWLPGVGALPALLTALTLPLGTTLELPWLFLGTTLAMNPLTQVFLTFTSLLWLVAGVYAAFAHRGGEHAGRFNLLFLLAMSGNLWLIVGQDLFSFYVGFAMMGLASYGLVIHDGQAVALRAGKVYLVMALFGEVCLFAALVLIASQTGTTLPSAEDLVAIDGLTIALLLLGLGVKAGMVPLHSWLPLAHPAAPIPASAVLSGTMIKTALLGWMRFLPIGAVALPEWGGLLAGIGTLTLLFALPIGLTQSDPKVVLAYSSISKMGLLMLVLGLALIEPALAPMSVAGIAFYAANHALVKGGLFLGVGMRKQAPTRPALVQALVLGALVFLALSLAGAPLTSGAVAKYELKPIFGALDWVWIGLVVGLSGFGTTLLMVRFVWVSYRTEAHPQPGYRWPGIAWAALIALLLLSPFVFGTPSAWLTNLVEVPLALNLGLLALLFTLLHPSLLAPLVNRIPPGDILALFAPIQSRAIDWYQRADQRWKRISTRLEQRAIDQFEQFFGTPSGDTERGLRQWPVAGSVWVGISTLLLLFVLAGLPAASKTDDPQPAARTTDAAPDPLQPAAEPSSTVAEADSGADGTGPPQASEPIPVAAERPLDGQSAGELLPSLNRSLSRSPSRHRGWRRRQRRRRSHGQNRSPNWCPNWSRSRCRSRCPSKSQRPSRNRSQN
jgi:hydrogenase-4 component B